MLDPWLIRRNRILIVDFTTPTKVTPVDELVILWLAANPPTNTRLDQQTEFRLLDEECRTLRGEGRRIRLEPVWAFGYDDIPRVLLQHKPHVVHLSAHSRPGGILEVADKNGQSDDIPPNHLIDLVRTVQQDLNCIRLVALNACNSLELAQQLELVVGCAVGIQGDIDDKVSHIFFSAFYAMLGWNAQVCTAFDLAINRVLRKHPYLSKLTKEDRRKLLPTLACGQCKERSLFMPPDLPPAVAPPAAPHAALADALFTLLKRLPPGEVRVALERV